MGQDTDQYTNLPSHDSTDIVSYVRSIKRESFLTWAKFAAVMYLAFFLYDMVVLPLIWRQFLVVRLLVVVPGLTYLQLVERRVIPFNFLTELVVFTPVTWANAYAVARVPNVMQLQEASLVLLLILSAATTTPWSAREFACYSALVMFGSVFCWHSGSDLTPNDLVVIYGVTISGLIAGLVVVQTRYRMSSNRLLVERHLLQHELVKAQTIRRTIEDRLLEAERHAFLAQHLGVFLADINEAITLSDLVVTDTASKSKSRPDALAALEQKYTEVIQRIESFLSATSKHVKNPQSEVSAELRSVLPLIHFEVGKHGFLLKTSVADNLADITVDSGSESLSVVIFKLMRLSIESLRQAKAKYPGSSFAGTITLDVAVLPTAVQITAEENGIGISAGHTSEFEDFWFSQHSVESEQHASGSTSSVTHKPRLGGGSVFRLMCPIVNRSKDLHEDHAPRSTRKQIG